MKQQCTTAAECLRELARVMEQFGIGNTLNAINSKYVLLEGTRAGLVYVTEFQHPEYWQFAIAEVEGKPVFIGDELYDSYGRLVTVERTDKFSWNNSISIMADGRHYPIEDYSWNPPRPKTVTVTYTIDEAKRVINALKDYAVPVAAKSAIAATEKALEELK